MSKDNGNKNENIGSVYIICMDRPLAHSRHYVGWTNGHSLESRFKAHKSGRGARMLRAANEEGIDYMITRVWEHKDRHFERWVKNQHNTAQFCPRCASNVRNPKGG